MIYLGNQAVGVTAGVGDFTLYEKKTAAGVGNSNTYIVVPTSFVPKLVLISGGTDASGHIISATMNFTNSSGGATYRNAANSNLSAGGYRPIYGTATPSQSAGNCVYYDGNIYISRVGSNGWFDTTDTFTFEIYG